MGERTSRSNQEQEGDSSGHQQLIEDNIISAEHAFVGRDIITRMNKVK